MSWFASYLKDICDSIQEVDIGLLQSASELILRTSARKGKVIIAGNGGSAAMASHVAVDLTKNARTRAINFNEADLITCLANDYGYEHWISKGIELYADPEDMVIVVSSSGKSRNILNAACTARRLGLPVVTFSGFDAANPLRQLGAVNFWVNSRAYNFVEMTHHVWLLAIVDQIIGKREYAASESELPDVQLLTDDSSPLAGAATPVFIGKKAPASTR